MKVARAAIVFVRTTMAIGITTSDGPASANFTVGQTHRFVVREEHVVDAGVATPHSIVLLVVREPMVAGQDFARLEFRGSDTMAEVSGMRAIRRLGRLAAAPAAGAAAVGLGEEHPAGRDLHEGLIARLTHQVRRLFRDATLMCLDVQPRGFQFSNIHFKPRLRNRRYRNPTLESRDSVARSPVQRSAVDIPCSSGLRRSP